MILCMNTPINPAPFGPRPVTAFTPPVHLPAQRPSRARRVGRAFGAVVVPAVLLVISVSCFRFLAQKQGSGKVATETRIVEEAFEVVELQGSPTVNVTIDPEADVKIEVTTDDNLLIDVTTEVHKGVLVIETQDNLAPTRGIRVDITVKSLSGARLLGSGDVNVDGISAEKFTARITGSGDVRLRGTAAAADLRVTGSGDLNADELAATTATAKITGSGDISLKASESASLSVTGSGDITIAGKPAKMSRNVTGSGDIHVK